MLTINCPAGTWQPPTYPNLDSTTWRTSFLKANEARRNDIANMWCWRFEVEHSSSNDGERLHVIATATSWLRMIKPYVTLNQGEASPFRVLPGFIDGPFNRVPKKNLKPLKEQMQVLCFGAADERVQAIKQVATALCIFTKKRPIIATLLYAIAQNAAWDAMKEAEYTDEDLLTTLKLTFHAYTSEGSCDERAKAWLWLANLNEKIPKKQTAHILEVARAMPENVIADAVIYLCRTSGRMSVSSEGYITSSTQLTPSHIKQPHLFDALAHLIPKRAGWWHAAHAMGLSVDEAIEQMKSSAKVHELEVAVPKDFAVSAL